MIEVLHDSIHIYIYMCIFGHAGFLSSPVSAPFRTGQLNLPGQLEPAQPRLDLPSYIRIFASILDVPAASSLGLFGGSYRVFFKRGSGLIYGMFRGDPCKLGVFFCKCACNK